MIDFLYGTLHEKNLTSLVVDVNGIGYELLIPLSTFDVLPPEGQKCKLLVHDYIREDAHVLFGFASKG